MFNLNLFYNLILKRVVMSQIDNFKVIIPTVADWDSMGCVITQTCSRAFQTLDQAFPTFGRAFSLLLNPQKLGRVLQRLGRVYQKLG